MSGRGFIAAEKPQQCDKCGEIAELRPYGQKGATVCHECAMENEDEAKARMAHHLFGEPIPEEFQ